MAVAAVALLLLLLLLLMEEVLAPPLVVVPFVAPLGSDGEDPPLFPVWLWLLITSGEMVLLLLATAAAVVVGSAPSRSIFSEAVLGS